MAKKVISIGVLILVILTASFYIYLPETVKLNMQPTRTQFSVWEDGKWELAATEYMYLYDGSTKMRAKSRNITNFVDGNIVTFRRVANYKDNITTIQTYKFDATKEEVEFFPISESAECINCVGKIVHFEYRDILYEGETKQITSPFSFGHKMRLVWQNGAYYAKVFQQKIASDKIIIKFRPKENYETFLIRMFDPSGVAYIMVRDDGAISGGETDTVPIPASLQGGGFTNNTYLAFGQPLDEQDDDMYGQQVVTNGDTDFTIRLTNDQGGPESLGYMSMAIQFGHMYFPGNNHVECGKTVASASSFAVTFSTAFEDELYSVKCTTTSTADDVQCQIKADATYDSTGFTAVFIDDGGNEQTVSDVSWCAFSHGDYEVGDMKIKAGDQTATNGALDVTFSEAFGSNYSVFTTDWDGYPADPCECEIPTRTTTGFTGFCSDDAGGNSICDRDFSWIAIKTGEFILNWVDKAPTVSNQINWTNDQGNFTFSAQSAADSECTLWGDWTGTWEANETLTGITADTAFNFTTFELPTKGQSYMWNVNCSDTFNNNYYGDNISFMTSTVYGALSVEITSPTSLSLWRQNDSNLTLNATVTCVGLDTALCGLVTAYGVYNFSSNTLNKRINETRNALPFFPILSTTESASMAMNFSGVTSPAGPGEPNTTLTNSGALSGGGNEIFRGAEADTACYGDMEFHDANDCDFAGDGAPDSLYFRHHFPFDSSTWSDIVNISVYWIGTADLTDVDFFMYNYDSGSWTAILSQGSAGVETVIRWSYGDADADNYISASGVISIKAGNFGYDTGDAVHTDHVNVTVQYKSVITPPDPFARIHTLAGTTDNLLNFYNNSLLDGTQWDKLVINSSFGGSAPYSLASGDLDGDGDNDIVAGMEFSRVYWFENLDGKGGSWTTGEWVYSHTNDANDIPMGDFDGDGDIDFMSVGGDGDLVFHNNTLGDATVWDSIVVYSGGVEMRSGEVGDFDGDGDLDVVTGNINGEVQIHNNTQGDATDWDTFLAVDVGNTIVYELDVGDLDSDGDLDIATGDGTAVEWVNNTLGDATVWTFSTVYAGNLVPALAIADIDNDGDMDIVSGDTDNNLNFHNNTFGDGNVWDTSVISVLPGDVIELAVGDVDGDGSADVMAGDTTNTAINLYKNLDGVGGSWDVIEIENPTGYGQSMHMFDPSNLGPISTGEKNSGVTLSLGDSWNVSFLLNVSSILNETVLIGILFNSSLQLQGVEANSTSPLTIYLNAEPEEEVAAEIPGPNVTNLINYTDDRLSYNFSANFTDTGSCSLMGNWSGIWDKNETKSVTGNELFNFTQITFLNDQSYSWGVNCTNTTHEFFSDINVSFATEPTVVDTCTCPGNGNNWNMDAGDFCAILTDCDLGAGIFHLYGAGFMSIDALLTTSFLNITKDATIYLNSSLAFINLTG